jgi:CRP-like cAMP-binding protein/serine/threonine protein phosphatase PrpC/serine/threonine protein kinase
LDKTLGKKKKDLMASTVGSGLNEYEGDVVRALKAGFEDTNRVLHKNKKINDEMSGCTCVVVLVVAETLYIANVGDSRAIIGYHDSENTDLNKCVAAPLSYDQTPYRTDERQRVIARGARVLNLGQIEGATPVYGDWGESDHPAALAIEEDGDPPRIWAKAGNYPGLMCTRSFGDFEAKKLGVCAEPEVDVRDITSDDRYICLGSDGIFEFLTNQAIMDTVSRHTDPQEACKVVVQEAYQAWLDLEVNIEDITMLGIFIKGNEAMSDEAPGSALADSNGNARAVLSGRTSAHKRSIHDVAAEDSRRGSQVRPVRRTVSTKAAERGMVMQKNDDEETRNIRVDDFFVDKTEEETKQIARSIVGTFIFSHTNESQRDTIIKCMQRVSVEEGQLVIKQGDQGDHFYVVGSGKYEVRVGSNPEEIELGTGQVVYAYEDYGDVHPSFGELALMYAKPRAASVFAKTPGTLWALDRRVFRKLLLQSDRKMLMRTLKNVEILEALSTTQRQRLCDIMSEVTFDEGEAIISQGEPGETFYIIMEGNARVSIRDGEDNQKIVCDLGSSDYFGERSLLFNEPRSATVTACDGPCKCLNIGKAAFEEVMGPLATIIDDDRKQREANRRITHAEAIPMLDQLERRGVACQEEFGALQYCTTELPGAITPCTLRSIDKADCRDSTPTALDIIYKEAKLLSRLTALEAVHRSHTLGKIQASFQDDNSLYILYENPLVCDLSTMLAGLKGDDAPAVVHNGHLSHLSPGERVVRHITACVSDALCVLHSAGVIYRAVAADMLYVDTKGRVVLTDFRFAKWDNDTHTMIGLPEYMAPEIIAGQGYGPAVDWWALGVLIYEVITGRTPFHGATEEATMKSITGHVEGGIQKTVGTGIETPTEEFGIGSDLASLINGFLHPDAEMRLGRMEGVSGTSGIQAHSYFGGFDWTPDHNPGSNETHETLVPWVHGRHGELQELSHLEVQNFEGDSDAFDTLVRDLEADIMMSKKESKDNLVRDFQTRASFGVALNPS